MSLPSQVRFNLVTDMFSHIVDPALMDRRFAGLLSLWFRL